MENAKDMKDLELEAIKNKKVMIDGKEYPLGLLATGKTHSILSYFTLPTVLMRALMHAKDIPSEIQMKASEAIRDVDYIHEVRMNPKSKSVEYYDQCVMLTKDGYTFKVGYDCLETGKATLLYAGQSYEFDLFVRFAEEEGSAPPIVHGISSTLQFMTVDRLQNDDAGLLKAIESHNTRETAFSIKEFTQPKTFFEHISLYVMDQIRLEYLDLIRCMRNVEDEDFFGRSIVLHYDQLDAIDVVDEFEMDAEGNLKYAYLRFGFIRFVKGKGSKYHYFYLDLLKGLENVAGSEE